MTEFLDRFLTSPPPAGKVVFEGPAVIHISLGEFADRAKALDVKFDGGDGDRSENIQLFAMNYRAGGQTYSWMVSSQHHEEILAILLNCRYGNTLLAMQTKDFEHEVTIPDKCDCGDDGHQRTCNVATESLYEYNSWVRSVIMKKYIDQVPADTQAQNILSDEDTIAAHVIRIWRSDLCLYLCTRTHILVLPKGHIHFDEVTAAATYYAGKMNSGAWLSILMCPKGARFYAGFPGKNASRHKLEELVPKSDTDAAARDSAITSVEAEFDLANLCHTWTLVWRIDMPSRYYAACRELESVQNIVVKSRPTTRRELLCVVPGGNTCLVHSRTCRKTRQLNPICEDYHERQCRAPHH